jgi:hypothetical protein
MSFMLIIFLKSNAQAQTQRNPPVFCDKYQEIDFPRVKIRVNIHFILDINGNNNYTPTDNGLGNASRNGIFAANKIIQEMNTGFSQMQPMISKKPDGTNHPHIDDLGVEYILYTNQQICEEPDIYGGIWFHNYAPYDINEPIGDGDPDFSPGHLESLFSKYPNVMNIFVLGSRFYWKDGVKNFSIGGEAQQGDLARNLRVHNQWYWAEFQGQGDGVVLGPTINHEVGHIIAGLSHVSHTYTDPITNIVYKGVVADESDINKDEETVNSNNLMTYNGCSCSMSLKQFIKFRNGLNKIRVYLDHSELCETDPVPIIISAGSNVIWDSYKELFRNVVIEPTASLTITCDIKTNAKFVVKRGAKLIVVGATISNLCPTDYWRGIEVWGNPGKSHPSGDLKYYTLAADDPGVVYLSTATLIKPVDGVFTWKDENYLLPDFWGGIIQANSTDFLEHRRGVAFMPFTASNNASSFNDCAFASTTGYAGITMWNVKNVKITNCRFEAQHLDDGYLRRGIRSIDANPEIENCKFYGNKYGLEVHSTFSFVSDPIKVHNKCNFSKGGSTFNGISHIYSNGVIGLDVKDCQFNEGIRGIQISGNSSFDIERNVLVGYSNYGLDLTNTYSRFKELFANYFYSSSNGSSGIRTWGRNNEFQFISNCFNHPRNDVYINPVPLFDDQGSRSESNNNYFHTYNNDGPELFSRLPKFNYWVPNPSPNPRAIPHCHFLTPKPDATCTAGYSLHSNIDAFTHREIPPNCSQNNIPDTIDRTLYQDEDTSFTYLSQKYTDFKVIVANQETQLENMSTNDPEYVGLVSEYKMNKFYRGKYQMKILQSIFSTGDYESLGTFLLNEDVYEKTTLIAGLEISKGNYLLADSILAQLANSAIEYNKYYTIEKIHLDFLQSPSTNFPTAQDSLLLEDVATDTTWVSNFARALLVLYFERYIDTSMNGDTMQQYTRFEKSGIRLEPTVFFNNPVESEINLYVDRYSNDDYIKFNVYDVTGKSVYFENILILNNRVKVDLSGLKPGLYLFRLESNMFKHKSHVIIKL